jgi:hypothetical protein
MMRAVDRYDLRPHAEKIARRLLGEPNKRLSTKSQLRFGRNGSLAVEIAGPKRGEWYYHEAGIGGGPWELLTVKGGMTNVAAVEWLRSELGIDLGGKRRIVTEYDYRDEAGALLFQVCRFEPKDFRQRRPDGKGGWMWQVTGTRQVPYRLPELIATPRDTSIFVVEGEKDCDRLAALGLTATCNPGGAAKRGRSGKPAKTKWRAELNPFFRSRDVTVVPDNDDAGRDHARAVAANLAPVAARVRILELPALPPKGDLSDWLDGGGTIDELLRLAAEAPDFRLDHLEEEAESENIPDPLEGLIDSAATDPGTPFQPDVLERLAALKEQDRAAFETLRSQLKKVGCRVTALDEAVAGESGETGGRQSQADILIELTRSAELFHTPDGTAFADLDVNGHRETWPIRAKGFRRWLTRRFFEETQGAPNSEALQSALNVIEARAHFDAPKRVVHIRVGGLDGRLYLDLCDETWRAIEIDATGWRVIAEPPVRFRRAKGMLPLPAPVTGGKVAALRPFLNLRGDADFTLTVAWLLAGFRDRGPYPILALTGEHGSAKTTFARILRALIDPNAAPLRSLPREDRDLFIAATNGYAIAFDNVSSLPDWLSDSLCRLSTGGGFATRELYSDADETLFDAMRPQILNGIEDFVTRSDLADRTIDLMLAEIPDDRRMTEERLWAEFEAARPTILGALLDAVGGGLAALPSSTLDRMPRMADFARWAVACEQALPWRTGTFLAAYTANRSLMVETTIEADLVATAVRELVTRQERWEGSASELLAELNSAANEEKRRLRHWPKAPNVLSGGLRRAAPNLRKVGIDVRMDRVASRGRGRRIYLSLISADGERKTSSEPSASSDLENNALNFNSLNADDSADDLFRADDAIVRAPRGTVRGKPNKINRADDADGADDVLPSYSGDGEWRG